MTAKLESCNKCSAEYGCWDNPHDRTLQPYLHLATFVSCCGGWTHVRVDRKYLPAKKVSV